jgi:hypothetical protein
MRTQVTAMTADEHAARWEAANAKLPSADRLTADVIADAPTYDGADVMDARVWGGR